MSKLGIITGSGLLAQKIVANCLESKRDYYIIALEGDAGEWVKNHPHSYYKIGNAKAIITKLKEENVREIVLAGGVKRPSLRGLGLDKLGWKIIAKAGMAAFGDDGILKAVIKELESYGFKVLSTYDILPSLLVREGAYGKIEPKENDNISIEKAIKIAREVGKLDVGQACVVQEGLVLAVEAIEGTEQMLSRVKELLREGRGGILAKVKKPEQETKADLPTIGVNTIEQAHIAGIVGIVLEAGGALMIDEEAVVAKANEYGIFVIGKDLTNE